MFDHLLTLFNAILRYVEQHGEMVPDTSGCLYDPEWEEYRLGPIRSYTHVNGHESVEMGLLKLTNHFGDELDLRLGKKRLFRIYEPRFKAELAQWAHARDNSR